MAVLHARGVMKLGDRIRGRSIIGSHFEGRIEQEVMIGDKPGIIPSIAGQAWLTEHINTCWIQRILTHLAT